MQEIKNISKCKHPRSRKTIALSKQLKKVASRQKKKWINSVKQNLIGEKVLWFRDNLRDDIAIYSPQDVEELIVKYLARFDEELQQIMFIHSTGCRKNRQHASREDVINLTKKRELEEFNTCGIEMPDILILKHLKALREWNGELRYLQNIKLRRISKKYLSELQANSSSTT